MTITGALNNAMSGLRAAGRGAEVVSNNLANALTPGYGKRVLELSSDRVGDSGGVRVTSVVRDVDAGLISDRRMASSDFGNLTSTSAFLNQLEDLLGAPDQVGSVSARIAEFGSALITAGSRPDAPERLELAVNAARDLAVGISNVANDIQDARARADASIHEQVNRLNETLQQLQELNGVITSAQVRGNDDAALLDQRQLLIDEVAEMVPIRTLPRDNGALAIYTTGGAVLLDGSAIEVGFERVNAVSPYMSIDNGALSGLTINGLDVSTDPGSGQIRGGTLGAQFEIRDVLAPEAQTELDALARDLIERFSDPAVDPTLTAGDAGLFTDNGGAFDPLDELGIASRITINAAVDPQQGGEAWRIRDGIGAVTQGPVGDATLLQALESALTGDRAPVSGSFTAGLYSLTDLASSLVSSVAADRSTYEQRLSFASLQFEELTQQELSEGVDSDAELRRMILIEQAYAANARIIETVDEMMDAILRI